MNWNVGDLARYIGPPYHIPRGEIVEIVSLKSRHIKQGYDCAVVARGRHYSCRFMSLAPIDDYNGNAVTDWKECPFQPKELQRV